MSIVSQTFGLLGQVGVTPRRVQMVVTDSYATLTSAGYLNEHSLSPNTVYPTDIFDVIYGYNSGSASGTYGEFTPVISNGIITLVGYGSPYVSGTWTPTALFGGASTGITYLVQTGRYTRIGNTVFIIGEIEFSGLGSSTGDLWVGGLPFATLSEAAPSPYISVTFQFATIHNNSVLGYVNGGDASNVQIQITYAVSGGAEVAYTNSDMTSSSQIIVSGFYLVS